MWGRFLTTILRLWETTVYLQYLTRRPVYHFMYLVDNAYIILSYIKCHVPSVHIIIGYTVLAGRKLEADA